MAAPHVIVFDAMVKEVVCYLYLILKQASNLSHHISNKQQQKQQ